MYKFKGQIRYSETGEDSCLRLDSVVNYLQDCSTFQSEDIGLGIQKLKEMHRVWVLNAWQIEIRDWNKLRIGENIQVGTWMHTSKGTMAERNFVIRDMEDNSVVDANSIWVLMDTETLRPVKITEENRKGYECAEKLPMEYLGRKVNFGENYEEFEPFVVRRHHLDSNHHVNNASYFQMAEEYLPENIKPVRMRAEYRKSAMLGDLVYPKLETRENGYTVALCGEDTAIFALIEVTTHLGTENT